MDLRICNLVSQGKSLKEAKAFVESFDNKNKSVSEAKAPKEAKETTAEKKERLVAEIEAAGGDVPAGKPSVAKLEEALAVAKAEPKAPEGDEAGDDLDGIA